MTKIAVFFKEPEPQGYPLTSSEYFSAYRDLSEAVTSLGGKFFIVRGQASYLGNGSFTRSWQFDDVRVKETGAITIDVLYDKGSFISDDTIPVLNSKEVNAVCCDKWKTYQLFSQHSPKTWLVQSSIELRKVLEVFVGEILVAKPPEGYEGKRVFIGSRSEFEKKQSSFFFPVLIQEFIDSSAGIPGITTGIHDFRVVILDGELILAYVRTPPAGSYRANYSKGGSYHMVSVEDIPLVFKEVIADVEMKMKTYGSRFYGVDLALTKTGPKIIELNSRVGMSTAEESPVFITRLSAKLLSMSL